ncbi:amidase [Pseudomonas sp. Fl5BN2]|uniref:amidase n=1 Tax=unclassified Pseudomonas TaxID=196821 RepID=UPI0013769450|nr:MULTISPECIES: amidase family protein [unclassified Pseudomonas]NBF06479.1 amidase [Pseudomonas sp. Fl5BN2]NBF09015.1 amidase [Pseudomonas sp. Fl4BN1]
MSLATSSHPALHLLSIEALLQGFATRQFTPVDLLQALLAQIERHEPQLNALCERQDAAALLAAQASSARWAAGQPLGRLDGIALLVKDNSDIQGWQTRSGSKALADRPAMSRDTSLVARLREAGAIFIGKTTLPELGSTPLTDSPLTGITRNPWNLALHAGGSSGGSTAGVAAGYAPAATGNDAAGSIRTPASFCGVIGFKPSHGLVSACPSIDPGGMAAEGPIARHVRDIALLMELLSADEPGEPFARPHGPKQFLQHIEDGVSGLRIAFSADLGYAAHVDPQIAAACLAAAQHLQQAGAILVQASPDIGNPAPNYLRAWPVEVACAVVQEIPAERRHLVGDFLQQAQVRARQLNALDYACAVQERHQVAHKLHDFLCDYDLLLTPTAVIEPFAVERLSSPDWPSEISAMWQPTTFPFNFSRQPALSMPCGLSAGGLPIGLQIVARFDRDELVLRAARTLEKLLPEGVFAHPAGLLDAPSASTR